VAQYQHVEQAGHQAVLSLRASLESESLDEVIQTRAGMPTREVSLSLLASLQSELFAQTA